MSEEEMTRRGTVVNFLNLPKPQSSGEQEVLSNEIDFKNTPNQDLLYHHKSVTNSHMTDDQQLNQQSVI